MREDDATSGGARGAPAPAPLKGSSSRAVAAATLKAVGSELATGRVQRQSGHGLGSAWLTRAPPGPQTVPGWFCGITEGTISGPGARLRGLYAAALCRVRRRAYRGLRVVIAERSH